MSTPSDFDEQLTRAIAGDQAALELMLLEHYDALAPRVSRMLPLDVRATVDVEDVLQETFVQAFRDIRTLEPCGQAAFAGWLETIAEHRAQDAIRRARRKKRGGDFQRATDLAPGDGGSEWLPLVQMLGGDTGTPSQFAAQHEAIRAIQVGVSALPPDQREAIRMHCLDRHSLEETADVMQRTPGAVRGLVQRGKIALRACLVRSSLWFSKR